MIKISRYSDCTPEDILTRRVDEADVSAVVAPIISDVRARGDKALLDYTERFDRVRLSSLLVTETEISEAYDAAGAELIGILKEAAENIRAFHINQKRDGFELKKNDGIVLGQRVMPINRVGIYVPGGTASYPSTVLMNAVPAVIAGVNEIIMVTPPGRDGKIKPSVLAAAHIAGVKSVYKVGGAQAVAALAYGTESIRRVDKIVGPGNAFVAEAKRQVFGIVDIDMIAGPSEILVISDKNSNPAFVAADLLSQAEHDKKASAVLITDSECFAEAVSAELERQITLLERRDIARTSIDVNGKIIIVDSIDTAVEVSNVIAPEHLEICVDEPFKYLDSVRDAGSVFLGRYCPEALGDYFSGTNHTLPTSGTARFSSPLSVDDFVKKSSYTYYTAAALEKVESKISVFAREEGLTAHARSVEVRFEK